MNRPNDVPDAETVLQPSLHDGAEWTDLVLDEVASRIVDPHDLAKLAELRAEHESDPDGEFAHEIENDALALLPTEYPYYYGNDTFLVWPEGTELPPEYLE